MSSPLDSSQLTFLAGGGEMGARMRALDWTTTPLGAPHTWPQSLRSTVSMLLPSKAQIALFWGPEFIVLYNDAYRPVFGVKHPDALGRPGRDAWREIWDTQLHGLLDGVVRTGEAFWARDLLFVLERSGFAEDTYFDVSYDPVRVESGAVGGVFCIVTETTERVVGERRLALLRDLAARNATARTERDACVLAIETLAGRPDIAFALAYFDDELQAATSGAEQHVRDGAPDRVKTLTIPSSTGGPAARLVLGVNPRRPFDDAYRSFLNLVADQLAIALTNASAYEAERQRAEALAELDRAKTAFFSNVSHEFRTPLTLLVGPLEDELADASGLPAAHRERIETAHRNALRLLRLVNTLLDFSRIEAGRIEANYEPTDLAALTCDLASAFRSAIEKAGLRLVVDCPPLVEPVYVDRDMWEKIVLNLLSNALKFTLEGEIRVDLRKADDQVELRVADTGVGISEADLDRVFERFHRVRHAQARTHEGTGIGLALVQELVRLHGGTVTAASQQGRGSTFSVRVRTGTAHLPADRIAAGKRLTSTNVGATPFVEEALRWLPDPDQSSGPLTPLLERPEFEANGASRSASRVLIADDNADMRDYLARILGQFYRVEVVADGGAALDRVRTEPPDLVLTDVMMPTLDGFGLLAAVRGDERTRSIPIILLSARAGEEARIEGLQAGADEYLVKPFSARELLASVASQLQLARLRRESERTLRYQSEQHLTLLNQAPLGVYLVDADFRIAELNPVARPMFGDVPGGVIGRDFGEVVHVLWEAAYADELVQIFRRTLETGVPYVTRERAEFRIDRGVTEYYEWRVDRITLPDGRFGLVCYFRDIAEQRAAFAAKAYLAAIVDSAEDAIIAKNLDGIIQSCNAAAEQLFGYSSAELVGRSVRVLIPPERQSEEDDILARLRRGERVEHFETVRVTKDGRRLDVALTISPVRDETGRIIGASKIGRDITAMKEAEAERLRLLESVQEAGRMKDEFLASLSHELRTPLNAILGYSRMLRSGIIAADKKEKAVETIEKNATSLAQIVEDVLDISRIVSGKIRLNVQPVEFPQIVKNAMDAIAPAADAKGVRVESVIDPHAAPISGDPERLHQVLWNLLSNAVKFTNRGGKVQVRLERVNSHVELTVSDTGIGISPEFLPHVFERFRQADASTTRERGGLGLGLSIARQLTELHGGTIDVSSAGLGHGATFRVRIPVMIVHPVREDVPRIHPRADSSRADAPVANLDGIHVLAVDDEQDALALVCEVLEAVGARMTTAHSAEEALEKLATTVPDVVVADLGMPRVDGFGFIDRLRHHANPRVREVPAAALTAYARSEDRMKALRAGFQIHLAKPIDPAELVTTIKALAKRVVVKNPTGTSESLPT